MKRRRIITCLLLGSFLSLVVLGCGRRSEEMVQNENETEETRSVQWLDYEDYKDRLLENRVSISDYPEDYGAEIGNVGNTEYKNLSFSATEFAEFPAAEEICLLRQEEIVLSAREGWDMMEQWLEEIGKRELVDMEKEVRVVTDDNEVKWDLTQDYPYLYPALIDHMDLKNANGALISTKDLHYMVYYDMADGKMTEYLQKDDMAINEVAEIYTEDVEIEGTLQDLGNNSYPLISGELTIQEGADLLLDYFNYGTVTKPAEGISLDITGVNVFHLKAVYGYCYDLERLYKGIPVSYVEKSGLQLVGCPYLPNDQGKKVYIVDDTGVSAFRGFSESAPMTELYSDDQILGVKAAAQLLSEKLAPGLRMEVEEVALEYAPYNAEILYSETLLIPSWRFEGVNNTKGEKLVAYVDVLTGDLYYYVIPEWHQVE